jgi:hypothetical protein
MTATATAHATAAAPYWSSSFACMPVAGMLLLRSSLPGIRWRVSASPAIALDAAGIPKSSLPLWLPRRDGFLDLWIDIADLL